MDHLRDALIKSGFSKEDILFPTSIDDVHVYNLRLPCIPRVIVKARTSQLVSAAVRVANQFDLKVQARSGGHNYANYGLGGVDGHLIVDLKYMDGFNMDRTTWQASVGPGVILKELCQLLHDNGGRVIPHGTCPNVAIGGERCFTRGIGTY
jgi:FAD/FMN-containing dehydrogenase